MPAYSYLFSSEFGQHINNFKSHLSDKLLAETRPTGRPGFQSLLKDLENKYKEIRGQIKAKKPGRTATDAEDDIYDNAKDMVRMYVCTNVCVSKISVAYIIGTHCLYRNINMVYVWMLCRYGMCVY